MKKFRFAAFLLTILTIALPATGCAEAGEKTGELTTAAPVGGDTTVTEAVATEPTPEIPDGYNLNGYEFSIFLAGNWQNTEFDADTMTGDALNDAQFERTGALEEKLGIKLNIVKDYSASTDTNAGVGYRRVYTDVTAGTAEFDSCMIGTYDVSHLAYMGYLTDLASTPYIDLEKPWWDARATEDLMLNGKLYYTTGEISVLDNNNTYCLLFNKQVADVNQIPNIYELVKNKQWTLEKYTELVKSVSADANGDGKYTNADKYGMLGWDDSILGIFTGSGGHVCQISDSGKIELTFYSEKTIDILDKYIALINDKSAFHLASTSTAVTADAQVMFMGGQSLFYTRYINIIPMFRDMDTDFGILPYPMYDEAQESYHSTIHPYGCAFICIPKVYDNLERTGAVLEYMAYLGQKEVTPAYYEINLYGKLIRDEESADMLDIIFSTRVYDVGMYYQVGSICQTMIGYYQKMAGQNTMASQYKSIEKIAKKQIDQINEAFSKALE
jgi:hypothetical protein